MPFYSLYRAKNDKEKHRLNDVCVKRHGTVNKRGIFSPEELEGIKHGIKSLEPYNFAFSSTCAMVRTSELTKSIRSYLNSSAVPNCNIVTARTRGWIKEGNSIKRVVVESEEGVISEIEGDVFVLSAGIGSKQLAKQLGITLPLLAMKGYTVDSLPKQKDKVSTRVITLDDKHLFFTGYPAGLRVSAFGDMVGKESFGMDPRRRNELLDLAREHMGNLIDDRTAWGGLRPVSPDDVPIIGQAKTLSNLYYNLGHGSKGLSLSIGSAQLLRDLLIEKPEPVVDPIGYRPSRFFL